LSAKEIFEASNYEKKYGGRILQKLAKRKGKLVTKQLWDKADKDQKADWLGKLPYSNPEEVARYIDVRWDALPRVIQTNMFESTEELEEATIEIPTDEKDIKAMLDKAKQLRSTEKDFNQSMKLLDLKAFAKFDKIARGHKDFIGAYGLGYDAGMGYDLPKGGGLEGNNPHKKNTFAYWLWMDVAGQGMSDA